MFCPPFTTDIKNIFKYHKKDLYNLINGVRISKTKAIVISSFVRHFIYETVSQSVIKNVRNKLYGKLQEMDCSYFNRTRKGDIMSRMTMDTDAISINIFRGIKMQKIMKFWNSLTTKGKIVVGILAIICAGPFGLIAIALIYTKAENDRFNAILDNPTEENVTEFLQRLHGINNHPDSWAKYRGLWNVINRSDKVTTATKEKFLAKLLRLGLYLNNTKVNDNYKQ
jgi:ABC-type multidrug transport system fused ATPase/permease subunit